MVTACAVATVRRKRRLRCPRTANEVPRLNPRAYNGAGAAPEFVNALPARPAFAASPTHSDAGQVL